MAVMAWHGFSHMGGRKGVSCLLFQLLKEALISRL